MLSKASSPAPALSPGLLTAVGGSLPGVPAPCTVYVGRISSEVSDDFVRQLLEKCGPVTKWNRAADPNTSKLTSFGFCDFEAPQGVWRALECLHEKQLCDKRLLVKCEEKAKQTIEEWKETRKAEMEKKRKEDADKEAEDAKKNPEKAGREAWAKAIAAAKKAKDGEQPEEADNGAKAQGPLTDSEFQEELLKESKDVAAAIAKLLAEKNKNFPELTGDADKDEAKDEDSKAEKELENNNDKENEKDKNKDGDNKADNDDKGKDGKGRDDKKSEERVKKRTRSEEARIEQEKERERIKKLAVSRHYRQSRRERDREQRLRDREREIEKEYQYRIREFERSEDHRIKNLKRDLRDLEPTEPSEREVRKMTERDLSFGNSESSEREWKRYREDRARERQKEREKDNADRALVQREADEVRRKKEAEEREERERLEREEEKKRKKKEEEEAEIKRKEEEEERRKKKEKEEAERRAKEDAEERRRRLENEEKIRQEEESKKRQEAAAAKLLLSVQEEMRNSGPEKVVSRMPTVHGTIDGPRARDGEDEKMAAKNKPPARAPEAAAPAPAAAPAGGGGGAAVDAKLRDDEMRRLIQQVPTDKAKAFAFDIDWEVVHQNAIIEKKLRPWVRKKVTEFLGAEEQGMIEFIMRKVSSHTPPATILAELEGFIDEEAENFTLKMWRMLIFEVLRVKAR